MSLRPKVPTSFPCRSALSVVKNLLPSHVLIERKTHLSTGSRRPIDRADDLDRLPPLPAVHGRIMSVVDGLEEGCSFVTTVCRWALAYATSHPSASVANLALAGAVYCVFRCAHNMICEYTPVTSLPPVP